MLKGKALLIALLCVFFLGCNNKPKKVAVWDSYLNYDSIQQVCSDTFIDVTTSVDSQVLEYDYELEETPDVVVSSNQIELPRFTGSDLIIKHLVYTLSFNKETNLANWVAWSLSSEKSSGRYGRTDDFRVDELLPRKYRVDETAYKESGYDRGHMCPAGDNKWSYQAMSESFLMSNICPQDPELNQKWWEHLEEAERRWARNEGTIYICCGPLYLNKPRRFIQGNVKVRIPDGFFKVILSLREGAEKAIGFCYVNDASRQPMESTVCTVDDIEEFTGIDFFANIDDLLEAKVEQSSRLQTWN